MGAAISYSIVALSSVIGAVGRDAGDLLVHRDLAYKIRQHGRVTDMAASDLDGPNLQCLLIDPKINLAPDPSLGVAVFARMPLTFALNLDPGAIDQRVQRPRGAPIQDVHDQGLLTAGKRAEVRHRPVQANQLQQAFNEARGLA